MVTSKPRVRVGYIIMIFRKRYGTGLFFYMYIYIFIYIYLFIFSLFIFLMKISNIGCDLSGVDNVPIS